VGTETGVPSRSMVASFSPMPAAMLVLLAVPPLVFLHHRGRHHRTSVPSGTTSRCRRSPLVSPVPAPSPVWEEIRDEKNGRFMEVWPAPT
jgi:hypothetical protein